MSVPTIPAKVLSSAAQTVLYTPHLFDINFSSLFQLIEQHFTTDEKLKQLQVSYANRFNSPILFPTKRDEVNLIFLLGLLNFNLGYHTVRDNNGQEGDSSQQANNEDASRYTLHSTILWGVLNIYFTHDRLNASTLGKLSLEECSQLFQLPLDIEYQVAPAMYSYKSSPQRPLCEKIHFILQNAADKLRYYNVEDFAQYAELIISNNIAKLKVNRLNDFITALIHDFITFNDQIVLNNIEQIFANQDDKHIKTSSSSSSSSKNDSDNEDNKKQELSSSGDNIISAIHIHFYTKAIQLGYELYHKFSHTVNNQDKKEDKYAKLFAFVDIETFNTTPYANYSTFMILTSYLFDTSAAPPGMEKVMSLPEQIEDKDDDGEEEDKDQDDEIQMRTQDTNEDNNNKIITTDFKVINPILTLTTNAQEDATLNKSLITHITRSYIIILSKLILALINHNHHFPQNKITTQNYQSFTTGQLLKCYNTTPPPQQQQQEKQQSTEQPDDDVVDIDDIPIFDTEDQTNDIVFAEMPFINTIPTLIQECITIQVDMFDKEDDLLKIVPEQTYPAYIHQLFKVFINQSQQQQTTVINNNLIVNANIFHYWCDVIVREYPNLFPIGVPGVIQMEINKELNPGYW